ncbi:hypothetical protein AX16_000516 [Volvariella volvacea WC 439]|nr:hypothetical protein AX16_000516 [Volvariella volvacea WC 439]
MSFKALVYAYVLGGFTFVPLVIIAALFWALYTSVPVTENGTAQAKLAKERTLDANDLHPLESDDESSPPQQPPPRLETNDTPRTRKGWLTMRRTFEESVLDSGYVTLVRSFIDARSKDPKKSRPKDMWYVVLKGKVLYLYEDEGMTECEAALELGSHDVIIYPEGLLDGELFARRNAICLRPKSHNDQEKGLPSVAKAMKLADEELDPTKVDKATQAEIQKQRDAQREQASDTSTPWFIFVRNNVEMEDWYHALLHAAEHPTQTPTLFPLQPVFEPADMNHLVATLDEQPDVIPMRWLNALIGRIFFSYYRTHTLESYIIGRLMKKLSKVKRPNFLTEVNVTEVSVGNKAPMLSKPMLKELTREGDAALEVHLHYKGEIRITIEATAVINLGARFKSYTVKLVLAAVLKELEGNLLVKVKRPPSNRIWYAFTHTPKMVLSVEPIVSDRQITWSMILSTIESRLKEIVQESIVMPNMDDIAFFESLPYSHRGGIWADASRREKKPLHVPGAAPTTTEDEPTISLETVTPIPIDSETASVPLHRTQSGEDSSSDFEPAALRSAATVPLDDSSSTARRRTWFSSGRSEDLIPPLAKESHPDDSTQRDRTTELDPGNIPSLHSRLTPDNQDRPPISTAPFSSTPSPPPTPSSEDSRSRKSQSPEHDRLAPPSVEPSRRPSTPSSIREPSPPRKSIETPRSTTATSMRDLTNPSSSTTTSGFLSSLKSKAADKQALKDSAKEAVRKWAVGWNNLRNKDSSNFNTTNQTASMTSHSGGSFMGGLKGGGQRQYEELPDHGVVGHNAGQKRSNYAEVRAAVTQREKERNEGMGSDTEGSWSSLSPTDIPQGHNQINGGGKARVVSGPSSLMSSSSTSSSASEGGHASNPSTSTSLPKSSTVERALSTKRSSPAISRSSTNERDSIQSRPASTAAAAGFLPPDFDDDNMPKPNHAPIQSQPQAKMMTIPGIHASHKNDVMSIGYIAPPSQQQPPNATGGSGGMTSTMLSSSVANAMMNKPAMQSMYRLWNKGAGIGTLNTGQQQLSQQRAGEVDSDVSSPSLSGQSSFSEDTAVGVGATVPQKDLIASPPPAMTAMAPPKLVPPPLPPRSIPTSVSTGASSSSSPMIGGAGGSQQPVVMTAPPPTSTSASEALKSIATKDTLSRASIEKNLAQQAQLPTQPQSAERAQHHDEASGDFIESNIPPSTPNQPTATVSRLSQSPPPLPPRRPQPTPA